jgi:hypothetical protein
VPAKPRQIGLTSIDDTAEDVALISRSAMPEEQPQNLAALKFVIREGAGRSRLGRGMIAEGGKIGAAIRRVEFEPDPTPMMSATITYYRPRADE